MKKLFKILAILGLVLLGGVADARTANDDPAGIDTVLVSDSAYRNWQHSQTIDPTSQSTVSFNIHYYAWHEGAQNMRAQIDALDNVVFEANSPRTVRGAVWADNLSKSTGSAVLTFTKKAKLRLMYTSIQKNSCKSISCQEGSAPNIFSANGQNVGNFPAKDNNNYYGNVVVTYSVTPIDTPIAVSGQCSSNLNQCLRGVFVDLTDTSTQYRWECRGENGGSTVQCSYEIPNSNDLDIDTYSATNIDEDSAKLKGRVSGADNVRTWFALSRTDSTPECTDNSERYAVSGSYDDGDYFSRTVNSLREDTRYYFRACGEDTDGNIDYGSVKTFRTDSSTDPVQDKAEVFTDLPSNIYAYSAQLNGHVNVNDTDNAKVYFVYGKSASNMDRSTSYLSVSRDTYFQAITGLRPNTTYYYQAVVRDENGVVDRGIIRSFRTRNIVVPNPNPRPQPRPNPNPVDDVTITVENVVTENVALQINKWVSNDRIRGYATEVSALPGETLYYKVRIVNNTDEPMTNIRVTDSIPSGVVLNNDSNYNDADKFVTWEVDNLDPGESRVFVTEIKVDENARYGDVIVSSAKIESDEKTEYTNEVRIYVEDNSSESRQAASIFGSGSGFLPTTLFGWLALLAFVLLIAYLISKILETNRESKIALAQLKAVEAEKINNN